MEQKEFDEKGVTVWLMVLMKIPIWVTGKVVIVDIGFCVLGGLILIFERGVLGLVLINKRRYWPKGVPAEEIIWHMQQKEVGDVDAVPYRIIGKSYHIMVFKETHYVMLVMTKYGTLENLEGPDTHQRYKGSGG